MTYINVEAGVYERGGVVDVGPKVAAGRGGVGRVGEGAGGGKDEVFVEEIGVAAGVGATVDVGCEGGVEGEEAGPVVDECYSGDCHESVFGWRYISKTSKLTLLLNSIGACARVIYQDGVNIVVSRVVGVQHRIRNIRHIVSSIALARNENLATLQSKEIYEVLEEAKKLPSDIRLARSI